MEMHLPTQIHTPNNKMEAQTLKKINRKTTRMESLKTIMEYVLMYFKKANCKVAETETASITLHRYLLL